MNTLVHNIKLAAVDENFVKYFIGDLLHIVMKLEKKIIPEKYLGTLLMII